ncbi:MAG: hypothetical protein AB8I08_21335 [Sandaracinaceae bacterium]
MGGGAGGDRGAVGGLGGADATLDGAAGGSNSLSASNGGGGGGGVGCVLIRNASGALPTGVSGFSPSIADGLRALAVRTN